MTTNACPWYRAERGLPDEYVHSFVIHPRSFGARLYGTCLTLRHVFNATIEDILENDVVCDRFGADSEVMCNEKTSSKRPESYFGNEL